MEPTDTEFSEDVVPIDIARLELGCGGVATVRISHRATHAETALGEIEAIAHIAADAVVLAPLDEIRGDATLHDEILDQVAHFVIDECSDHGGLVAEAFPQATRRIVFAAALPCLELAGRADAALAGIEAEHDFAHGNLIKGAFGFWFDGQ